jgi:hypothetical protein
MVLHGLFFVVTPPQWHHTPEELTAMASVGAWRWFQFGYCAWRFTEDGELRADVNDRDRRWDPRCWKPQP